MTRTLKTGLLAAARLTNMVLVLAVAAILARRVPRATYGAFQQVLLVYIFLSVIFLVGLPQSIFYFLPRYQGRQRKTYMFQTVLLMAALGALLSASLYLGSDHIGRWFSSPELPRLLRAFAPAPIFLLPFLALDSVMMTLDRPLAAVTLSVLSRLAAFVAVVTPVLLGCDLTVGIHCWVIAAAISGVLAIFVMLRAVGGASLHDWRPILSSQLRFTLPIGVSATLGGISSCADKAVVSGLFGPIIYAGYANGAMEVPVVPIFTGALATVLFPELVLLAKEGRTGEMHQLWETAIKRSNVVVIPFLGMLLFLAPEVMTVLFGREYVDSAPYFQAFLWILPIRVALYGPLAMSFGANWTLFKTQAVAAVASPVLSAFFAWWTGNAVYASIATVISSWLAFMYAALKLSPLLKVKPHQFLPMTHWLKTIGLSVACGLVGWAVTLPLAGESSGKCVLRLSVACTVFAVLFLASSQLLRLSNWRDIAESFLPRRGRTSSSTAEESAGSVDI